jgi:ABC-type polysaccharide/polyol phosphate export permease
MEATAPSLRKSWVVQKRVIGALLMREILTRYGRHNIGFLWLFAEPMTFTLAIALLWSQLRAVHGSDLPIVAFALAGYSSVLLWRNMPSRCIKAIEPNAALMYHRNVTVLDIYISRTLLEAFGATISFAVLSLVFISLEMIKPPEDLLKVTLAWSLLAWFGFALAILVGAYTEAYPALEKLWSPVSYIMFPLSGAAFMVDTFSPELQQKILWIPMVHGVELLRDGYFGSKIHSHYDVFYLLMWCVVLSVLGLAKVRVISRNITAE